MKVKKMIATLLCSACMVNVPVHASEDTSPSDFTCEVKVTDGNVGTSRLATVTYAGGGSGAPLVRIEAGDGAYVRFSEADGWSKSVEFIALDGTGTQNFFCLADKKNASLELSYTQGSTNRIPWSTMKLWKTARPSYVDSTAWNHAEYELEERLGSTWNDYLSRLKTNAEYLEELGLKTCRTDRLMALEINRALGINAALPTLASATDISRSARGLPLAFSRSFSSAMYAHFNCGVLGYGWTDNYSLYAELADETTLVIRLPSGGSYSFSKVMGAWQPEDARDATKLTETSDVYVLTYENGMVQTFAKSNMRLKTISDNVGNALTFAWSGATNLISVTHTDGQYLKFSYDADGLLVSVTDDLGNHVSYAYNSKKMLTEVTGTDELVTKYSYNDSSYALKSTYARTLNKITYPDMTTRTFDYYASSYTPNGRMARLLSITDSTGATVKFTYPEPDIATICITASDNAVTTIDMGPSGEVLKATDALGNVVTRTYDGDGLLQSILAPSGKSGQYAYDARGRVTTQTSAAGNKTTFDYTEFFGNLKTLKDAKNQSVTYGYDDKGRATSIIFPDGAKMLVEYNAKGDVAKTTNCRGQSETYGYDAEGRVTSRIWANGRKFTYAYDAKGRLITATDSESGKVSMAYDDGDRLTKITYPNSKGFAFTYDSAGRLAKRTAVDGTAECYAYDSAGRISEVTDGNGALYLRNTYDATTGRLSAQTYGNGTSASYLYDLCGRITSIVHKDASGKITESLQYCYDEDGRCVRAASLLGEERYTYDDDGQLTGVTYPVGENESFAYDAVGNRTSANGATYTVNNLNQYTAVDAVGSAPRADRFTYDADGNLTSKTDSTGTTTYTYDQQNRLIAVSNPATKLDWSCTYDVLGNRVSVTTNGVTTTRVMLPGALPSVAAEYQNNKLVKRHIVVGATQIADIDAAGHSNYYHGDLIGSTRLITDQTGATVNRLSYKAFGEVRSSADATSSSRLSPTVGYVGTLGVETDPTGLLFMRNRYYDPQLGRFLQRDPIGLSGGDANWYRYCGNGTVVRNDPNGKFAITTSLVLAGVLKLAIAAGSIEIIVESEEEIADLLINGEFNKSEWLKNCFSLVVGKILGPMFRVGDLSKVRIAKNFKASTVAKKLFPYLSESVVESYFTDFLWENIQGVTSLNVSIADDEGIGGGDTGGGDSGSGDSGGGGDSDGGTGGGDSGGGTSSGLIMNEADWTRIATNKNASTATFSLGADITLTCLFSYLGEFNGTINGNGHKIILSGEYLDSSKWAAHRNALAGKIYHGAVWTDCLLAGGRTTFNNVVFTSKRLAKSYTGCTFRNCTSTYSGVEQGAFADKMVDCVLEDCSANVTLSTTTISSGGLVGTAENCYFTRCKTSGTIHGGSCVGGLVGSSENSNYVDCQSSASVTGESSAGGLIGSASEGTCSNCRYDGTVTGSGSSGAFVGCAYGIKLSRCTSTGLVNSDGTGKGGGYFGGFAGKAESSTVMTGCMTTSIVSAGDESNVGGFVGTSKNAEFINCLASGTACGVSGVGGFAGGLLGGCTLTDCVCTGTVTANGTGSKTSTSVAMVGGFQGSTGVNGNTFARCYATGKVVVSKDVDSNYAMTGGFAPVLVAAGVISLYEQYGLTSMITCEDADAYWNPTKTGQKYSGVGRSTTSAAPTLSDIGSTLSKQTLLTMSVAQGASIVATRLPASVMMTALSTTSGTTPRLYAYDRYVLVKGYGYSFSVTGDSSSTVSVSGLPKGLAFANGYVTGKATATGTSSVTITTGDFTKTVTFEVIDAPTGFAEQFMDAGGELPVVTSFAVSFDANGGIVDEEMRKVEEETQIGTLPTPIWAKHKFDGWYTAATGGTKVTASTKVTADVTYYAHWTYDGSTTVAVNVGSGCEGMGTVSGGKSAKAGTKLTLKATAKKGYVFAGWYLEDAIETIASTCVSQAASYSYVVGEEDATLCARFIPTSEDYVDVWADFEDEYERGEAIEPIAIVVDSGSLATVKVTGLPTGLKFTAKALSVKATKTTPAAEYAANTIYGTPTRSGVYAVTVAATTAGKATATETFKIIVRADGEAIVDAEWETTKGKVTGMGICANGKTLTLKAVANKGYAFAGWYSDVAIPTCGDEACEWAYQDPIGGVADYRTASLAVKGDGDDVTYYARFVAASDDGEITAKVEDEYAVNGPWSLALDIDSLSLPTVTVKGLPTGLKFDAKTLTISGTPTKPGSYTVALSLKNTTVKKAVTQTFKINVANIESPYLTGISYATDAYNYRGGVAVGWDIGSCATDGYAVSRVTGLPAGLKFNVKTGKIEGVPTKAGTFTATIALKNGKMSSIATVTLNVQAIDTWAYGTFNGGSDDGQVQLTITSTGKLSGKYLSDGLTYALASSSFSHYANGVYQADVKASWSYKDGRNTVKKTDVWPLTVEAGAVGGRATNDIFSAWQNVWSQKNWKTFGISYFGQSGTTQTLVGSDYGLVEGESIVMKVKANGSVTLKGVFATDAVKNGKAVYYTATGSAVVCAQSLDPFAGEVFIYFPPNATKKFNGYVRVVSIGE